ncbi:MAG: NAD(P)H-hydrate epimerase [Actinomycetales bacterium]|nr:NAD(P)H-hydrate epimerase [Actinomycetales bacterium]
MPGRACKLSSDRSGREEACIMRDSEAALWPVVDEAQMREVDRVMIEDLGVSLLQMMENAGRNLAALAITRFDPARVVVMCGSGGNGGGGLASARHLSNRGIDVRVVLSSPVEELTPAPREQVSILRASGVDVAVIDDVSTLGTPDLVIDALIGYSLRGAPSGKAAELVAWANGATAPVLSLDVPTGFSAANGTYLEPHIGAAATLTLAAPKRGLIGSDAAGDLYVGDITVPPQVYDQWGYDARGLFARDWLVRLRTDTDHR